jgi:hypothetical protein
MVGMDERDAAEPAEPAETEETTPQTPVAKGTPKAEAKPLRHRDWRVSDAEREHVVDVLQKAIGRGLLDLDEFTERTDVALAAKTRGELNAVLTDLPGLVHRDALAHAVPARQGAPYAGPPLTGRPLELNSKYGSITRTGRWTVPESLVVSSKYGHVKLDFSTADIRFPVVHVQLDAKWGSVELIIPEQGAADLNGVTDVKFGSVDDRTGSHGRHGNPMIVVSGRVHGGSMVVRYPRRGLFSS